jgi:hypothetical protein
MPPQVASSFSHMLNLHNLTEEVANTQTERAGRMGQLTLPTRSTNASFIKLTTQNGVAPEDVYQVGSVHREGCAARRAQRPHWSGGRRRQR